ncbi:MAG: YdeI/OmpD-associated family protein [Dysgonamonadaceae bacterium]|jgi:hypothetical protein|nr:YdeI/OmpD-associated family protein [Dysgonamonadaceae bacterium]
MEKPLVDKTYLLQSFAENGGWTYTIIPEIAPDKNARFGWVKVRGSIDGYEIKKYHLMPSGEGTLMLFVKAEIRKKIKKQAGDTVHIILYSDNEPLKIPEELLFCLQDEPKALTFFNSLNEREQHQYIKWIYSAKTDETKVDRIAKAIERLLKGQKFGDPKS